MKTMTQAELTTLLGSLRGATFATLTTETMPKLLKTGNTLGTVRKVSRVNVTLGFQYAPAVNRQLVREGETPDFIAAPRQWGERVAGTVLVTHHGTNYLETKVEKSLDHKYLDSTGNLIPDEMVRPFLPSKGASRQGVKKEILVRDYAIESIRAISLKGEEIVVVG